MKKFLVSALAISLFCAAIPAANARTFSDVSSQTDYQSAIYWMADNGIINGDPQGTFRPDDCVNRAEMLKLLFEARQTELSNAPAASYPDLPRDEWFTPYVDLATLRGTINGYEDGTFKPAQCVNRVEAAKMAVLEFNFNKIPAYRAYYGDFTDIDPVAWYYDYLDYAMSANLFGRLHTTEVYEGHFRFYPADYMTRKEVAEMLYRMKAIEDSRVDLYKTNETEPTPFEYAFDDCGTIHSYSGEAWYNDLTSKLNAIVDSSYHGTLDFKEKTDACLSLDGEVLVLIVSNADGDTGAYIGQYQTGTGSLQKAEYMNYETDFAVIRAYFDEFLARDGVIIPVEGAYGDANGGFRHKAEYNYVKNTVTLKERCDFNENLEETSCTSL